LFSCLASNFHAGRYRPVIGVQSSAYRGSWVFIRDT
jgi:hypothetical protein